MPNQKGDFLVSPGARGEIRTSRLQLLGLSLRAPARLAKGFGITVIGPHMTLRYYEGDALVQVSFQVTSITSSDILTPHDPEYNK